MLCTPPLPPPHPPTPHVPQNRLLCFDLRGQGYVTVYVDTSFSALRCATVIQQTLALLTTRDTVVKHMALLTTYDTVDRHVALLTITHDSTLLTGTWHCWQHMTLLTDM